MTRAVVLRFNDNAIAENFVRALTTTGEVHLPSNPEGPPFASVEIVIGVPTRWCKCRTVEPVSRSAARRKARKQRLEGGGWMRGTKYGWWLCVTCNKPSKPVVVHWFTGMLHGCNNLLPEILGTGESETPSQRWIKFGGTGTPQIKRGDGTYEHL